MIDVPPDGCDAWETWDTEVQCRVSLLLSRLSPSISMYPSINTNISQAVSSIFSPLDSCWLMIKSRDNILYVPSWDFEDPHRYCSYPMRSTYCQSIDRSIGRSTNYSPRHILLNSILFHSYDVSLLYINMYMNMVCLFSISCMCVSFYICVCICPMIELAPLLSDTYEESHCYWGLLCMWCVGVIVCW